MRTEMRSDVPLTLLPENVTAGAPDTPVTRQLRDYFTQLYAGVAKFHDATRAIESDSTLTQDAKIWATEQTREKMVAALTPVLDRALSLNRTAIEGAERKLAEAARPVGRSVDPREIRDHVRSLKDAAARASFLMERAAAGDAETVHAITSAPQYLSGLDVKSDAWDALVSESRRRVAPDAAGDLDALRGMDEKLGAALESFGRYMQPDKRAASIAARVAARTRLAS